MPRTRQSVKQAFSLTIFLTYLGEIINGRCQQRLQVEVVSEADTSQRKRSFRPRSRERLGPGSRRGKYVGTYVHTTEIACAIQGAQLPSVRDVRRIRSGGGPYRVLVVRAPSTNQKQKSNPNRHSYWIWAYVHSTIPGLITSVMAHTCPKFVICQVCNDVDIGKTEEKNRLFSGNSPQRSK